MAKLTKKQKRSIRRKVAKELGVYPPKHSIHKSKKAYTRKNKHKKDDDEMKKALIDSIRQDNTPITIGKPSPNWLHKEKTKPSLWYGETTGNILNNK